MKKKVGIVDTILRDAHQSLVATRMTTEQMLPILETLDQAGYHALEVWGGATFDACLRYLNEDPWERLRVIRQHVTATKLQMLLRGQNLLGYHHYADDVVEAFIAKAIENGIDIIRVFDALNDINNLRSSIKAIRKYGKEAQVAMCYTTSVVHTPEYFVELAQRFQEAGATSIAIKDMAGVLTPHIARTLLEQLKKVITLPISVHTHATSGVSEMTYLMAVLGGADVIDTAISPFAGGTSQPATESMAIALEEMGYDTGLNMVKVQESATYFKTIKAAFRTSGALQAQMMDTDPNALIYQVPGGMLSNLFSQLQAAQQEAKYEQVLQEVPKVRADLGYPPLVTPLSQMVGTQAVMNVISQQRYQMIPKEIKDYVRGLYGQTPIPIQPEIVQLILGDDKVTQEEEQHLDMAAYRQEVGTLALTEEEVLMFALFPTLAKPFLQKRRDPFYDIPLQLVNVIIE